jgi:hypothetical protein
VKLSLTKTRRKKTRALKKTKKKKKKRKKKKKKKQKKQEKEENFVPSNHSIIKGSGLQHHSNFACNHLRQPKDWTSQLKKSIKNKKTKKKQKIKKKKKNWHKDSPASVGLPSCQLRCDGSFPAEPWPHLYHCTWARSSFCCLVFSQTCRPYRCCPSCLLASFNTPLVVKQKLRHRIFESGLFRFFARAAGARDAMEVCTCGGTNVEQDFNSTGSYCLSCGNLRSEDEQNLVHEKEFDENGQTGGKFVAAVDTSLANSSIGTNLEKRMAAGKTERKKAEKKRARKWS